MTPSSAPPRDSNGLFAEACGLLVALPSIGFVESGLDLAGNSEVAVGLRLLESHPKN